MQGLEKIRILFIAGFGPIVRDADDVESATAELESMGYQMIIKNKQEPWGQTVSRFLDSDGILVGLTFTPLMRDNK